jgi:hypothetical protein
LDQELIWEKIHLESTLLHNGDLCIITLKIGALHEQRRRQSQTQNTYASCLACNQKTTGYYQTAQTFLVMQSKRIDEAQPHRLAKKHAMDCGQPGCVICGNPRHNKFHKGKDRLTTQERSNNQKSQMMSNETTENFLGYGHFQMARTCNPSPTDCTTMMTEVQNAIPWKICLVSTSKLTKKLT